MSEPSETIEGLRREVDLLQRAVCLYEDNSLHRAHVEIQRAVDRAFDHFIGAPMGVIANPLVPR